MHTFYCVDVSIVSPYLSANGVRIELKDLSMLKFCFAGLKKQTLLTFHFVLWILVRCYFVCSHEMNETMLTISSLLLRPNRYNEYEPFLGCNVSIGKPHSPPSHQQRFDILRQVYRHFNRILVVNRNYKFELQKWSPDLSECLLTGWIRWVKSITLPLPLKRIALKIHAKMVDSKMRFFADILLGIPIDFSHILLNTSAALFECEGNWQYVREKFN